MHDQQDSGSGPSDDPNGERGPGSSRAGSKLEGLRRAVRSRWLIVAAAVALGIVGVGELGDRQVREYRVSHFFIDEALIAGLRAINRGERATSIDDEVLIENGLTDETVWGERWSGNSIGALVKISYPVERSGAQIADKIADSSAEHIYSVSYEPSAETWGTSGMIRVWLDFSTVAGRDARADNQDEKPAVVECLGPDCPPLEEQLSD